MKLSIIRRSQSRGAKRKAFTLVELLLVLVILGTLAAIVLPRFGGTKRRAQDAAAKTQITTFKTVLNAFEVDNGYFPETLEDLVQQPRDAKDWRGPYLDSGSIPLDPWGHDYLYQYPGRNNPNGYDLMSMGFDGRENTDDDITNWESTR